MRHCKIAILIMAMCTLGVAQDKTADKKLMGKPAMAHDKDKAPGINQRGNERPRAPYCGLLRFVRRSHGCHR